MEIGLLLACFAKVGLACLSEPSSIVERASHSACTAQVMYYYRNNDINILWAKISGGWDGYKLKWDPAHPLHPKLHNLQGFICDYDPIRDVITSLTLDDEPIPVINGISSSWIGSLLRCENVLKQTTVGKDGNIPFVYPENATGGYAFNWPALPGITGPVNATCRADEKQILELTVNGRQLIK